jgi:SOS-response transcriptional repressor LexA
MKTINEIRLVNARLLTEELGGRPQFSKALEMDYSLLSNYIGKTPKKNIGDDVARRMELAANKKVGWLDKEHDEDKQPWNANVTPATNLHRVPVISWVRAGAFCDIEVIESDDFIYVDAPTSPHAFALEVSGDSMTTSNNRGVSFPEGMVIVVDPDKAPKAGDYVIIKDINKQAATFKQYMTDGISNKGVPLNRDYDTIDLDDERYRIIGVVVEAVHRMKF